MCQFRKALRHLLVKRRFFYDIVSLMKTIVSKSLSDTQNFAREWLGSLGASSNEPRDSALVVGLYGNLGAGKTAFTQALARELGIQETVTSPTYVIEKIYETSHSHQHPHPNFVRLIHIDAYRLESGKELQTLGFEALVENPNNLIIVEWPENVKEILPPNHNRIYCEFIDENSRKFEVQ